jgi:hypothetical protein
LGIFICGALEEQEIVEENAKSFFVWSNATECGETQDDVNGDTLWNAIEIELTEQVPSPGASFEGASDQSMAAANVTKVWLACENGYESSEVRC